MRKNNKIILNNIRKNLNFYDRIILCMFKRYTIKIYRMGVKECFNWENQKYS